MNINQPRIANQERVVKAANGWGMLVLLLLAAALAGAGIPYGGLHHNPPLLIAAIVLFIVTMVLLSGLFTLQPNEARVLVLFGEYQGTVRRTLAQLDATGRD